MFRSKWIVFILILTALTCTSARAGESTGGMLRPASAPPPAQKQTPASQLAPLIELDGTISISPDGSELSYAWKQLSGPKVELSDPAAAKPSFRTNKPGIYEFQLVVSANGLSSEPHIVRLEIEHENLPPVAKVPAEAFGQVEKILEIDGRQSFDPEGQSLIYRWRPLTPGLDIPLSALSMPILRFEPKKDGVFEVELIVSDGEKASLPALCRITVKPKPRPPVAQARIITVGAQPTVADATPPAKKTGRPVAQVKAVPPPNRTQTGQATVTAVRAPTPTPVTEAKVVTSAVTRPTAKNASALSVTASGLTPYAAVNGGASAAPTPTPPATVAAKTPAPPPASAPRTEAIARTPIPPLPPLPGEEPWEPSVPAATAPPAASSISLPVAPISVPPLSSAGASMLDADIVSMYGDSAPEGSEALWSFAPEPVSDIPDYSASALFEPSPMAPPEQPAKPRYDVMSAPMTTLPFDRPRPTAKIKGPKVVELGHPAILDARESGENRNGGRLEYTWRQKRGPEATNVETLFDGAAKRFSAPVAGVYEFELVVSDGGVQSAPVSHSIRFTDQAEPPVAVVVAPTKARLGALITMDATQSYDISGTKLIYRWRQTGGPSVRNYVIDERLGESSPAFYPPAPGQYSFELIVSNGKMNSRPVEIDMDVEARLSGPPQLTLLGPDSASVGESVALDAKISEGGRGFTYGWRQKEGPAEALSASAGERAVALPTRAGRYVFEVAALEAGEAVATSSLTMDVSDKPQQKKGLDPLPQVAGGAPYIGPATPTPAANGNAVTAVRGGSRVPSLAPLPNTPSVPSISSFPPPTLPDGGRGRPAAKVMQAGKPPLADL